MGELLAHENCKILLKTDSWPIGRYDKASHANGEPLRILKSMAIPWEADKSKEWINPLRGED